MIENVNFNTIYKMNFIYNAVCNGWTVRKISDKKIEYTNSNADIKKEFILENFIDNFIKNNTTIDKIIKECND